MAGNKNQEPLRIADYNGGGRGGKGTITSHLEKAYDFVTVEETGRDYRLIAALLFGDGVIEPDMPQKAIRRKVRKQKPRDLADIIANRDDIVSGIGLNTLYEPNINKLVGKVSPQESVRRAVKGGLRKRVEQIRDRGEHSILLLDGRNLAAAVGGIAGTNVLLKTFVTCDEAEAARREVLRTGAGLGPEEARQLYYETYQAIKSRNEADRVRSVDSVTVDEGAIDYWNDPHVLDETFQFYADANYDGDYMEAMRSLSREDESGSDAIRIGAGYMAVTEGRQILFDTTPFRRSYDNPMGAMLIAAEQMFREAASMTEEQPVSQLYQNAAQAA